jgi:NRPS condensation-like uncharacterized protein
MNPKIDSYKRRVVYFFAVFPVLGRNNYERMNSRLERQIGIREVKRKTSINQHKNRQLYPFYEGKVSKTVIFFDN